MRSQPLPLLEKIIIIIINPFDYEKEKGFSQHSTSVMPRKNNYTLNWRKNGSGGVKRETIKKSHYSLSKNSLMPIKKQGVSQKGERKNHYNH